MKKIYVAACTDDGGLYRFSLDDNGMLGFETKVDFPNPMYMVVKGEKMHIILRDPFADGTSGVINCDITEKGLENPTEPVSTKGKVACHIAVEDDDVYCANYVSGSIIRLPDNLVIHEGEGPSKPRQDTAHAHYVGVTPDKKYLCAVDLGCDTIFVYNRDMTLHSKASVPSGHGARHIVFSDDDKYMFCANELESTVSAFAYNDGELTLLDTVNALPADFDGKSTAAAIRVYNKKIYISHRGHDSVAELTFRCKKLKHVANYSCGGAGPRDFDFIGDFMVCTNEKSGDVTVFDCKNGFKQTDKYPVPAALCVVEI